ncbi:MAG: sulfotransferase [Cyanobacteria bacterium P01_H01_bin.35]
MKSLSQKPVFVVGCSRSGTTLLQSLLATHSQIVSFPESKLFLYLVPETPSRRIFGIASRRVRSRLKEFFRSELKQPEVMLQFSPTTLFISQYVNKFVAVMDSLTKQMGKSLWLEKTPEHIFYVENIEKFIPGAKFIHIIRNGEDVVASMYELAQKYPKFWADKSNIDVCIDKWMRAVAASHKHLHKPNHVMVRYEDLVENSQNQLVKLCNFMDVEFEENMLQSYHETASSVTLQREYWKENVYRKIEKPSSPKFERLFDESQRQYILERVTPMNLKSNEINN